MSQDPYSQFEHVLKTEGAGPAFQYLTGECLANKDFGRLFEARLMQSRHELGLPLMPAGPLHMNAESQKTYDKVMLEAAGEAARLFLDSGNIAGAWPYYRALGDHTPIREALERLNTAEADDSHIEIALGERVHPGKGYEMLLHKHGICRAITLFDQYPDPATREDALSLLSVTLHRDLTENLIAVIERNESARPPAAPIPALIAGRDWLFGEYCYHVDVSHLMSIVRLSAESDRIDTIGRALELAEYGSKLDATLQHASEPPFEDFHTDHAIYFRARLGQDVDAAIAHFRCKIESYNYDDMGTYPVQIVVRMLLKFDRPKVALEVYDQFLTGSNPSYLNCPPLDQLCRMASDFGRLKELARGDGDLIRYAAAVMESGT